MFEHVTVLGAGQCLGYPAKLRPLDVRQIIFGPVAKVHLSSQCRVIINLPSPMKLWIRCLLLSWLVRLDLSACSAVVRRSIYIHVKLPDVLEDFAVFPCVGLATLRNIN